jgi:hypothetical protein
LLKNIQFKDLKAMVLSIQPQGRVFISWNLHPTTQDLSSLKFFVYRGESPHSLKAISTGTTIDDPFHFIDFTDLIDVYRLYWYQIHAVEYDHTGAPLHTFKSEHFTWDGEQDLVGIYIVEEHEFAHRYVYGVPALIYPRKRTGIYCPECFDKVLKRVTKSRCFTCFGTGYVGGFYKPIEKWLEVMTAPADDTKIAERGDVQNPKTMIRLTNYPIVKDGDVIVEMQQDRYWKINAVTPSEKHRYPVLQICDVSEIGRTDVEQFIQVDPRVRERLVSELVFQRREREF